MRYLQILLLLLIFYLLSPQLVAQEHPHKVLTFPCNACHVTATFKDMRFNHDRTKYTLEGLHQGANCLSCHDVEDFGREVQECASCHQDVHQAKLGNDCLRCHTPNGWSTFDAEDIHAQTRFPLLGRHILVDCQSCHKGLPHNDFALDTTTCESCHQQQFLDTQSPNHIAFGFAADCQECHQMNAWQPAFLPDHDALFFPIFSGEHKGKWDDCSTCHADLNKRSLFSCVTCHEHNQPKMDEEHQGIPGYVYNSQDCLACHPTGEKADFRDHDAQFFPIFSGKHKNKWDDCKTCHDNANNRKVFSCVDCHEHAQGEMDPKHNGITGYVFNSPDCYFCHPTGEKGQFTDHDPQFFPIFSGTHNNKWDDCSICHTDPNSRKVFSCVTCHEHEQSLMDPKHDGIPGYMFNSADCYQCHPTGEKGEFRDHDAQFFPIFSGKHNNKWDSCATCHNVSGNNKIFTCFDCHEHNQQKMDDKHLGEVADYRYDSNACYDCHPNGKKE